MILKLCNLFHKFPTIPENSDVTSRGFGSGRYSFKKNSKIQTNTEILPIYPNIYGITYQYPRIATNSKNLVDIFIAWKGDDSLDESNYIIITHIDP